MSLANLETYEGTVSGDTTITFNIKPKKVIITNDSGTKTLGFKFNSIEDTATLNPTETITIEVSIRTLILSGTSVAYRVWGFG